MASLSLKSGALGFCLIVGLLDLASGVGFLAAPGLMLRLMGVREVFGDLVYLRFVGAFVFAVGGCYLWALRRWRLSGDLTLVRAMMELTIIFRLATGTFAAWAILRGWLIPLWAIVTVADYVIAAAQAWLLHRRALG